MNITQLEALKSADIRCCDRNKLCDLKKVKINGELTFEEKLDGFFMQVKNPYLFKVGDTVVKTEFSSERSFCDALLSALEKG